MTRGLIFFISILIFGCEGADIKDLDKRNENWVYWADSLTGESSWIPIGDETTVKDGRFTLFFTTGQTYKKGKLRNGKNVDTTYFYDLKENLIKYSLIVADTLVEYYLKDGDYVGYFQNGKFYEKGIVKKHKRGNEWTCYFKNGNIESVERLNGRTGWTIWYYDNGQVWDSSYHINGKGHGKIKHWYKNGNQKEICDWDNGVQNGIYEFYYENGNPKEKSYWVNGKLNGKRETWHENGQLEMLRFYVNDSLDGNLQAWYPNGNIRRKSHYVSGKEDGSVMEFHENGKLFGKGNCKNGRQIGIWLWYNADGKLMERDTYKDGQLVNVEK